MSQSNKISNVTVKLEDLTKVHQELLHEYLPLVEQEFSVESASNVKSYKGEVVDFVHTIETIFGKNPPNTSSLQGIIFPNYITETALESCRLFYRKQFRRFTYLTGVRLQNAHKLAENEAMNIITEYSPLINDVEQVTMREKVLQHIILLRKWIQEVNAFKKNNIIREIKAEILSKLEGIVREKLPDLFEETEVFFYQLPALQQKFEEICKIAYESFRQEIPFEEDELSAPEMYEDFGIEVENFLESFQIRNKRNKGKAKEMMASTLNASVKKYKENICKFFIEESMTGAHNILERHKSLQERHLPCFLTLQFFPFEWKSNCINNYFRKTDEIFQKLLIERNHKISKAMDKYYQVVTQAVNQTVNQEIATIFSTHKIPYACVGRLQKSVNDQIEKLLNEIKDLSIANPEIGGKDTEKTTDLPEDEN